MADTLISSKGEIPYLGKGYATANAAVASLILALALIAESVLTDKFLDAVLLDTPGHPFAQILHSSAPLWAAMFALAALAGPTFVYITAARMARQHGASVTVRPRYIAQLVLAGVMTVMAWSSYEGTKLAGGAGMIQVSQTLLVAMDYEHWCDAKQFGAPASELKIRQDALDARANDIVLTTKSTQTRAWSASDPSACMPGTAVGLRGTSLWARTQALLGVFDLAAIWLALFAAFLLLLSVVPVPIRAYAAFSRERD